MGESPTRTIFFVAEDSDGAPHTFTHNVAFQGRLYGEGKILARLRALEAELNAWNQRPPE